MNVFALSLNAALSWAHSSSAPHSDPVAALREASHAAAEPAVVVADETIERPDAATHAHSAAVAEVSLSAITFVVAVSSIAAIASVSSLEVRGVDDQQHEAEEQDACPHEIDYDCINTIAYLKTTAHVSPQLRCSVDPLLYGLESV